MNKNLIENIEDVNKWYLGIQTIFEHIQLCNNWSKEEAWDKLKIELISKPLKNSLIVDDVYETGLTLTTFKDIEGAMFFVLFSKIKPTWWNTVFISKKSQWIVFPWENTLNSKNDREDYIKKRGLS